MALEDVRVGRCETDIRTWTDVADTVCHHVTNVESARVGVQCRVEVADLWSVLLVVRVGK